MLPPSIFTYLYVRSRNKLLTNSFAVSYQFGLLSQPELLHGNTSLFRFELFILTPAARRAAMSQHGWPRGDPLAQRRRDRPLRRGGTGRCCCQRPSRCHSQSRRPTHEAATRRVIAANTDGCVRRFSIWTNTFSSMQVSSMSSFQAWFFAEQVQGFPCRESLLLISRRELREIY